MSTFSERLKDFMQDNGITQAQLAECTGIDVTHISHYVTGYRKPGLDNIEKILRCLCGEADDVMRIMLGD